MKFGIILFYYILGSLLIEIDDIEWLQLIGLYLKLAVYIDVIVITISKL